MHDHPVALPAPRHQRHWHDARGLGRRNANPRFVVRAGVRARDGTGRRGSHRCRAGERVFSVRGRIGLSPPLVPRRFSARRHRRHRPVSAWRGAVSSSSTGIGMPSKVVQQAVTQPAPSQAADGKGVTTQIEREAAAPAALPLPPPVRPPPPSDTAAAMPELFVPAPLIVPERRSTRRRGQVF